MLKQPRQFLIFLLVLPAGLAGAADVKDRSLFSILDGLVYPVETIRFSAEGKRSHSRGSGFVMGRYYVTATKHLGHNPDTISYVAGKPLWHGSHFSRLKISVLPLSDSACQTLCSQAPVAMAPETQDGQAITWMDKALGRTSLVHAHVSRADPIAANAGASCEEAAWIKVDQPFRPESFGVPVVNAGDGAIIGVAVDNLRLPEGTFGVVVPFSCLLTTGQEKGSRGLAQVKSS